MGTLIERRERALIERLDQMRQMDEWHLFQNFVLGLLPHDAYTDVRHSVVRNDYGRDGLAVTPQGERCFVAVSFDCSLAKIRKDAKRFLSDPQREDVKFMLFVTWDAPTEIKISEWRGKLRREPKLKGLDLRVIHRETIAKTATREGVWRETCSRLGIVGHRAGYLHVAPYNAEVIRRGLRARPPEWLRQRVPLREWAELSDTVRSRLILGKPGAGKTTTLFVQLERARPDNVIVVEPDLREPTQLEGLLDAAAAGAVIVFDDVPDNPDMFRDLCAGLLTRRRDAPKIAEQYQNVTILAAARSQEWAALLAKLPLTYLQDLGLLGESKFELGGMSEEQCADLIRICRDEWALRIDERVLERTAQAAVQRDATPLFVISMLSPARVGEDRRLKYEHLARLAKDVLALWQQYWDRLEPVRQGVLRLVKLFWAAKTEPQPQLLHAAAKTFGICGHDLSAGLDWLERAQWITRPAGVPTCLDVQLEAIYLDEGTYDTWDEFVHGFSQNQKTGLQLHNGTGAYYVQVRAARGASAEPLQRALRCAVGHFEVVGTVGVQEGHCALGALALNNVSACYGELATLARTLERRREWLERAVKAIDEAVRLYGDLGWPADLAMSLNNASIHYADLATLETALERRREWLGRAVKAVEESVRLRRDLGLTADLAASLSSASNRYVNLATLEQTLERRREWLDRAVQAVEEAVRLRRELGLRADLAMSLNNASNHYAESATLEKTPERPRAWLDRAVEVVEEAVHLYGELGLRGDLASALNNASNRYAELATLEKTLERRREWLERAVKAVEEAVRLYGELGLQGDLGSSLANASNRYAKLAELENTLEGRRHWMGKAVETIEGAIRLKRESATGEDLAISLGAAARHYRGLVKATENAEEAKGLLRQSLACVDEAVALFRSSGNTAMTVTALRDNVVAHLLLAAPTGELVVAEVLRLCDEGLELAGPMGDDEARDFFQQIKDQITAR